MDASVPIVVLNRGGGFSAKNFYEAHINYALIQARLSNPAARIVVFGDDACRESLLGVESEFVDIAVYDDAWADLRRSYVHLSPNPLEFDLFALGRWMILRDWMRDHGIQRCLHIDPDLMLYASVEELLQWNGDAVLWASKRASGHCSLMTAEAVKALADVIISFYANAEEVERLRGDHETRGVIVSDMHFISRLSRQLPEGSALDPMTLDPVLDHNFNVNSGGWRSDDDGLRVIEFENGHAFGYRSDGTRQRFATLHFQGLAKQHMHRHLACRDDDLMGRALIRTLQSQRNAQRAAALESRSIAEQNRRLGEIRLLSESLRDHLRRIRQSRWNKLGSLLRLSDAASHLESCEDIRRKVRDLAPRSTGDAQ